MAPAPKKSNEKSHQSDPSKNHRELVLAFQLLDEPIIQCRP